jgi:hypothetical protein
VSTPMMEAMARIAAELYAKKPMVFSPGARYRLESSHAEFLGDMGQEAVRIARRADLVTVDEAHVTSAYERISAGPSSSNIATAANSLGGVFTGAALASGYAIFFTEGPHTPMEFAVGIVLTALGFTLLAISFTISFLRK